MYHSNKYRDAVAKKPQHPVDSCTSITWNLNTGMPKILTSTLKGIVDESTNKISRTLFKMAVEQAISMNVIASMCNISPVQLEQLRGSCVKQVKQSNGAYTFDDAYKWQKG